MAHMELECHRIRDSVDTVGVCTVGWVAWVAWAASGDTEVSEECLAIQMTRIALHVGWKVVLLLRFK